MNVVFGANLDKDPYAAGNPRRQYGNAVLSVDPIVDWENTLLPRFDGHEQRGLLRARIDLRGVTWQVYNTQLQHNDAGERLVQTGPTFYTPIPRRIDYVLRSRVVRASGATVIRSIQAWTASDHLPVVANLAAPSPVGPSGTPC